MANLAIKLRGDKELAAYLHRAGVRFGPELEKNIKKAALEVAGQAQRNIKGSRTRSRFAIKNKRRVRRPRPRAVTAKPTQLGNFEGHLRDSIVTDVERRGRRVVNGLVGTNIHYARLHELGLGGQPRRPFLEPALVKMRRRVFQIIRNTFRVYD